MKFGSRLKFFFSVLLVLFKVFLRFISFGLLFPRSIYKRSRFDLESRLANHYEHNYSVLIPEGFECIEDGPDDFSFLNEKKAQLIAISASNELFPFKTKESGGMFSLEDVEEDLQKKHVERFMKKFANKSDLEAIQIQDADMEVRGNRIKIDTVAKEKLDQIEMKTQTRLIFYPIKDQQKYRILSIFSVSPRDETAIIDQIESAITWSAFDEEK